MKSFLDTNILVYLFDQEDRRKQQVARATVRGLMGARAAARCPVLLTEDLQAGRTVRGVEIRNPFLPGGELE